MQSRARSASWPDAILTGALAGLVLLAWWALWLWGKSPYGHVLLHGAAPIFTVAGLYQFSRLKYACLDKCRSPMSFIISRWQGGNEWMQSLRIGVEHGVFCVGCCWSLMLLMFVVGSGSLSWMLLLGA